MTKRKGSPSCDRPPKKRLKKACGESHPGKAVDQPLLNHCYRDVKTLRDYLLNALPQSSRVRRKRIISAATDDSGLSVLLTGTLVGLSEPAGDDSGPLRLEDLRRFTQAHRKTQTPSATTQKTSLEEILLFVVWTLFKQCQPGRRKPNHLLCHGLDQSLPTRELHQNEHQIFLPNILRRRSSIPYDEFHNPIWQTALSLVGEDGEAIFVNLMMDCAIFVSFERGLGGYRQVSGVPIHDLCLAGSQRGKSTKRSALDPSPSHDPISSAYRTPGEIFFVRSRILYSRPMMDRTGHVQFGLPCLHIVNRLTNLGSKEEDLIVMRHVFPRQFKMHNVFTSIVDRQKTVQLFKDYSSRESELRTISAKNLLRAPRRLRGGALQLIRKLRRAHVRCAYPQLLAHYCPLRLQSPGKDPRVNLTVRPSSSTLAILETQVPATYESVASNTAASEDESYESSFLPFLTPAAQVSNFCLAVVTKLLPADVFGAGDAGTDGWMKVRLAIDRFVKMRRFESMSLYEVAQSLKLKAIPWLAPQSATSPSNLAAAEKKKREELLLEMLYYIFDSILIPLIASNFYVTESGIHRNKMLYFRQDVWQRLCQPSLAAAISHALTPVGALQAQSMESADTEYNTLRILPKDQGFRIITNLRRRWMKTVNGRTILAQSTNTMLTPVFNIFNYERQRDKGVFHCEAFSTQDLHLRLSQFRTQLGGSTPRQLFFVKVDIQSAFDSIPQQRLLELVNQIFKHEEYDILKFARSKMTNTASESTGRGTLTKFFGFARPTQDGENTDRDDSYTTNATRGAVFSDVDKSQRITARSAKTLLEEHILGNTLRIGNTLYRQRVGIPQGSVLSSLLCTFFYNDFEQNRLSFLDAGNSLLLRVIDDFLLISTDQAQAVSFIKEMKAGHSCYGIFVHPQKSLVNFELAIDGVQIPAVTERRHFPFCGLFIDTQTLEVTKDRVRKDNLVGNTLTVDRYGRPGEKLRRRLLNSLRIQLQPLLLDCMHNRASTVAQTISECFQETAMKMHQYLINLPEAKRPPQELLIGLIEQLITLAARALKSAQKAERSSFSRRQVCVLAASSILKVVARRPTRYGKVMAWLEALRNTTVHSSGMSRAQVVRIVEAAARSTEHYEY